LFDIPVLQGRSQELDMEFTNIPELSLDTPNMGDEFDLPSDEKGDLFFDGGGSFGLWGMDGDHLLA